MLILGCDFTSSPTVRKPILICQASYRQTEVSTTSDHSPTPLARMGLLQVEQLHAFSSFKDMLDYLKSHPAWVGGFDFPFGLPSSLVQELAWPQAWYPLMQHYTALSRAEIRMLFKAYCDARPAGQKFAHRATDLIAGSSPSMKWVNPPVAYMMHAGLPLLLELQAQIVGLHQVKGATNFFALEAYPGMLARQWIGHKSYKSDGPYRQDPERAQRREKILQALCQGVSALQVQVQAPTSVLEQMLKDGSGDSLDACLCAVSAAWSWQQYQNGDTCWGLSPYMHALEGEIVSARQLLQD